VCVVGKRSHALSVQRSAEAQNAVMKTVTQVASEAQNAVMKTVTQVA
jgi:hypothetical protein